MHSLETGISTKWKWYDWHYTPDKKKIEENQGTPYIHVVANCLMHSPAGSYALSHSIMSILHFTIALLKLVLHAQFNLVSQTCISLYYCNALAYSIEWALILCDNGHLCPAKLLHDGSNCRRNIHVAGEGAKECLEPLSVVQSRWTWCKRDLKIVIRR